MWAYLTTKYFLRFQKKREPIEERHKGNGIGLMKSLLKSIVPPKTLNMERMRIILMMSICRLRPQSLLFIPVSFLHRAAGSLCAEAINVGRRFILKTQILCRSNF